MFYFPAVSHSNILQKFQEVLSPKNASRQTPKLTAEQWGQTTAVSRQTALTRHYESSKKNPHGGNEGAKSQHEANEEPHSSACKTR